MRKIILLLAIVTLGQSVLYSRNLNDTSSIEKRGWLVYYLGHVIWFESDITDNVKDKHFFTLGGKYSNGLIVDYNGNAKSFKDIAKCYPIKVLLQTDSIRKEAAYISEENMCIIPVKAKVKFRKDSDQFDFAGVSFKRNKTETTIEYWFNTNYFVSEIELLRKKDRRKMSRINSK